MAGTVKTSAHALTLLFPSAVAPQHETSSPFNDDFAPKSPPATPTAAPQELVPSPPTTPCNRTPQLLLSPNSSSNCSPNCSPSSSSNSPSSSSITAAAEQLTRAITKGPGNVANSKRFAGRTILIVAGGTRGDVQPAAAMGVSLAAEGARVRLAADASFREWITGLPSNLEFCPLGGSARDMMTLTVKWGGMLPTEMSGMFRLRSQIKEVMDSVWLAATDPLPPPIPHTTSTGCSNSTSTSSSDAYTTTTTTTSSSSSSSSRRRMSSRMGVCGVHAAFMPDLILANQLAYGQVSVAEKLQVPLHVLYTIPWLPTTTMPHPWARAFDANIAEWAVVAAAALISPAVKLCGMMGREDWGERLQQWVLARVNASANRMSTPLLDHTAWSGIADIQCVFRRRLGLPLLSANNLGNALYRYPTTCLFSPLLVPKPPDWPSHVTLTGFLSLSDAITRYSSSSSSSSSITTSSSSSSSSKDSITSVDSCGSDVTDTDETQALLVAPPAVTITAAAAAAAGVSELPLSAAVVQQHTQQAQDTPTPPHTDTHSTALLASNDSTSSSSSSSSSSSECVGSYQPPADLEAFLSAGPPPLYVGFGSMVVPEPQALLQMVLTAAQMLHDSSSSSSSSGSDSGSSGGQGGSNGGSSGAVRLLVCSGWSGAHQQQQQQQQQQQEKGEDEEGAPCSAAEQQQQQQQQQLSAASATVGGGLEVFFASEVPHEWLFPRCRALVHHGGVGTVAVGLKHGKPTLVIPAFGDLFFWGDVCARLGVGPPPLPLKGLTVQQLAPAMQQLLAQPSYSQAAQEIAQGLKQEDGLEAALMSVQETLCGGQNATCTVQKEGSA